MKIQMAMWAIQLLISKLDAEDLRRWKNKGTTKIREVVTESENKVDDFALELVESIDFGELVPWVDAGLDMLENKIKRSITQVDDALCLPLIGIFRVSFNVPDNDAVVA